MHPVEALLKRLSSTDSRERFSIHFIFQAIMNRNAPPMRKRTLKNIQKMRERTRNRIAEVLAKKENIMGLNTQNLVYAMMETYKNENGRYMDTYDDVHFAVCDEYAKGYSNSSNIYWSRTAKVWFLRPNIEKIVLSAGLVLNEPSFENIAFHFQKWHLDSHNALTYEKRAAVQEGLYYAATNKDASWFPEESLWKEWLDGIPTSDDKYKDIVKHLREKTPFTQTTLEALSKTLGGGITVTKRKMPHLITDKDASEFSLEESLCKRVAEECRELLKDDL